MNNPIPLSDLKDSICDADLLITSASFETRCLSLVSSIPLDKIKTKVVFVNSDEENTFGLNVHSLCEKCKTKPIRISFNSSMDIAKKMGDFFGTFFREVKNNIYVDITTFTHEGLLILIRFLYSYRSCFKSLKLFYIPAESYAIDEENPEDKWLSKGIASIKSVLGYPGLLLPSRKTQLIILFGFEVERTKKLIEEFDIADVSLAFSSKENSINSEHHSINISRHNDLVQSYSNIKKFDISLKDPYQTELALSNFVSISEDQNIIIAPMSNKISTVGAALFALKHKDVQLCYVKAKEYNINGYSKSSESCYVLDLDLSF